MWIKYIYINNIWNAKAEKIKSNIYHQHNSFEPGTIGYPKSLCIVVYISYDILFLLYCLGYRVGYDDILVLHDSHTFKA